jgi:hypothetical protein
MRLTIIFIAAVLLLSGCGSALQSKPEDVTSLSQGHGIVVGSIVLKTREEAATFPIAVSEKKWHAYIRQDDHSFMSKAFPPPGRGLDIQPDGKEVPFVSVLPAGKYRIEDLHTSGVNPNYVLTLKINFSVEEKKKTYIGRLVITIPSHVGMLDTLLFKDRKVTISVEDAQNDTVALLSKDFGASLADGLQKVLITAP